MSKENTLTLLIASSKIQRTRKKLILKKMKMLMMSRRRMNSLETSLYMIQRNNQRTNNN